MLMMAGSGRLWLPEGMGGAWPEVSWWIGEIRRWSSFLVLAGDVVVAGKLAGEEGGWPAVGRPDMGGGRESFKGV
ncbi:hypothetical protein Tco_0466831, partial [Tanacetum coccineum]